MSEYYTPQRVKGLYDPVSLERQWFTAKCVKGSTLGQSSPQGQTNGKKGLTRSSFLFSALNVLGLFQNAETGTFLWVAFNLHCYKCDLDSVFDYHLYGFVAVRATRGEWGLGIENGIFEDDPSAMRTIAYIVFLSIHSCFSRGGLLPTRRCARFPFQLAIEAQTSKNGSCAIRASASDILDHS